MTAVDLTFTVLAVTAVAASIVILLRREAHRSAVDGRAHDDYVADIRAMNTYNSYFMTAIVVFFGFAFGATDGGSRNELPHSALTMLSLAFVAASAAMYYVPVKKAAGADASHTHASQAIRSRWLAAVICSHMTVVLSVCGVLSIVVSHFVSDAANARRARSEPAAPPGVTRAAEQVPGGAQPTVMALQLASGDASQPDIR